uniref:Uncharacterized protein n=1 Tax=Thermosporothrix sp. COM3 TaxID=2490863 RepID=A0A455STU1_9CHLR|nr:hypothetical protein KTC_65480 [Thermosporothrix sp. COM3]
MLFVEEERGRIALRGPLWWDVAAFLTLVKEAETSQEQPEVALPLWQEAEQLSRRGLFLSDDLEAPWYELQAVRAVRLRIEKARQQVQRGLALGLFATAKALEEAHLQLQLYFEQYPTDRAAVEHLLHLADRSHQHQELVLDVLSQVQGRLDASTRARWPLSLKQHIEQMRKRNLHQQSDFSCPDTQHFPPPFVSNTSSIGTSWAISLDQLDGLLAEARQNIATLKACLFSDPEEQCRVTHSSSFQREEYMFPHDPTKRQSLLQFAAALGVLLTGSHVSDTPALKQPFASSEKREKADPTLLHRFENLLLESWTLLNCNQFTLAERLLMSFLPSLLAFPVEEKMARLASIGLRLQSVLAHHRLDLSQKLTLCQQAVTFAQHGHDHTILAAALVELANAYEFHGDVAKSLLTLQEALTVAPHTTPLIQSRIYSNNAVLLAQTGRKREAEWYIQYAQEIFPDTPQQDPRSVFADSSVYTLAYHAGLVALALGKLHQVSDAFTLYQQWPAQGTMPERLRLEIWNGHSKAAIQMNELEHYAALLTDSLSSAQMLGSKKRYQEAVVIFQQELPSTWRKHALLREVAATYGLQRGTL